MMKRTYFLFDGMSTDPVAKVKANTLEDAQIAMNEILGEVYDWHEVEKNKDTYYDYSIQVGTSHVMWFRLKRVFLGE